MGLGLDIFGTLAQSRGFFAVQRKPGDWWTKPRLRRRVAGNGFIVCLFRDKGRLECGTKSYVDMMRCRKVTCSKSRQVRARPKVRWLGAVSVSNEY